MNSDTRVAIRKTRPPIPDSLRMLPRRTRTLLSQLNSDTGVPIPKIAYAAFRAAGWTQEAAYSMIVADVKAPSAARGGTRWDRDVVHIIRRLPSDACQEIVGDWGTLALSAHEEPAVRLKAIDIGNRVLRRYSDEGVTLNIMGDVKLSSGDAPAESSDGPVLD